MFFNMFFLALKEIRRNVLRSFLTVLGIVIGVASVIAMVIIGDGTTAYITNDISKLGSNMLTLMPGKERRGPPSAGMQSKAFSERDVMALERETTTIEAIAPYSSSNIVAVYGNKTLSTSVYGSNNAYFKIRNWKIASGREFSEQEMVAGKAVCVIGQTIKNGLFGNQSAVEKMIRLENFSCKIIGVLASKGSAGFGGMDQDDLIITPLKMFQRRIGGNKDISTILLSLKEGVTPAKAKNEVTLIMREQRRIRKNMDDNFHLRDMKELLERMTNTTKTLTLLLGAVAAISLLVGGIGIMNIMLVSVTERTREIGIRLAIGAREHEVLLQFLVEAVVLSSLGGLIGIVFGVAISYGATHFFSLPFTINTMIILIAFVFSMFVGIFFGYFPARKAATLNPIDALRYE